MPHYGRTYARIAQRTIRRAEATLEELVDRLRDAGLSDEDILVQALDDLDNDGPIFGGLFSGLESAGEAAIVAAGSQGQSIAHIDGDAALRDVLASVGVSDVDRFLTETLENGDPDAAFEAEQITQSNRFLTWVAVLQNTCHACLPLHGVTKSAEEWQQLDLDPATIHEQNGIMNRATGSANPCYCRLVEDASGAEVLEPLRRMRTEPGVSKKTVRLIGSKNLGVSQKAAEAALESKIGRRTLRRLGSAAK